MTKNVSYILIGAIVAIGGCQKPAPSDAGSPSSTDANSLVGSWQHVAKDKGSNATFTFNPDGTMSFTATNGPKQQPYTEKGIGEWDYTGGQLSMTPLSIDFSTPSSANTKKLMPYVKKQENVRSAAPVVWKSKDEFVLTKDKVDQDFQRTK